MKKTLIGALVLLAAVKLVADCENVHCGFEYVGACIGSGYTEDSFLNETSVSEVHDKYCVKEFMTSLRRLNWYLYQMELAAGSGNLPALSNAVASVSSLLCEANMGDENTSVIYPPSLKQWWLENIEYSLARIILSDARRIVVPFVGTLLPDSVMENDKGSRRVHSLKTFKQMLLLAVEIENYREKEECLPLNLDMLKLPEATRKCACGRDIEYEQHAGIWVLRSRCESYDGGLKFDEYLPTIYQQRKRLDLCLSSTFNEKRAALFKGEILCPDDNRLSCQIIHDMQRSGVHPIKFASPSAGTGRIIPLSEQAERNSKCTKTDDSVVE